MGQTRKSKYKLLVVDDEPEIREFLTGFLCEKGLYEIIEAETLGETLDIVSELKDIDLVVLDLIMPDSKGLEALHAVREQNQDLPVVVLTGYPGLSKQSASLGAKRHFEKPFVPNEIESEIFHMLGSN